jgi:tRNA nucleotidyltransferase (CCA-adding enzyme)
VIREAERSGVRIALVGGVVRDLLRGRPAGLDVDVVVEGDAGELARRAAPDSRVTVHARFGTATIAGDGAGAGGFRIDLARARRERYPRPGALPAVEPAAIEEDLSRRDFTVNAIAWDLAGERLLDPFGGARDLAASRLRVLHARSFEDDPTRIFRAVRYASRLGLELEPTTRRLLRRALASGVFASVSGDRLRNETAKLFAEPDWPAALRLASRLGLLAALEPSWRISPRLASALLRAAALEKRVPVSGPRAARRAWLAGMLVAASDLSRPARRRLARRLSLAGEELRAFEGSTGSREEAIARAALAPTASERKHLERRLTAPARLSIRGADLVEAGVPAGPAVGRALGETRVALEEGRIEPVRGEELEFAVAAARRHREGRE